MADGPVKDPGPDGPAGPGRTPASDQDAASGTPASPSGAAPVVTPASRPAPKPAAAQPPKAAAPTGPPDPPPPEGQSPPAFVVALASALPDSVTQLSYYVGDWTVIIPVAKILEVARYLRDAPDAAFDQCSDVTVTDWPARPQRFDLIYALYSIRHRHRVRLKTMVAVDQPVPSVTSIWPAANWLEREIFDMFGVIFAGHPDLRRILMPEDWQGHPQRKDYPLEGPGELLMENPIDWLKLRQSRDEADIE